MGGSRVARSKCHHREGGGSRCGCEICICVGGRRKEIGMEKEGRAGRAGGNCRVVRVTRMGSGARGMGKEEEEEKCDGAEEWYGKSHGGMADGHGYTHTHTPQLLEAMNQKREKSWPVTHVSLPFASAIYDSWKQTIHNVSSC